MQQTRLHLTARKPEANHIASILDPGFEDEGLSTVLFETEDGNGEWCYSVYVPSEDVDQWKDWIRNHLGDDCFGLELGEEELPETDWVSQTLRALPPGSAGRFFVHGSHDRDAAANKRVAVEIDAGQAFGTGHHGTTAGCLDMLELCLRQSSGMLGLPRRAMDIGTGSGVLAIALAKVARIPVLATDIDPIATKVARENCIINGVGNKVRCETATGFQHPVFNNFGKTDLIFANILARPLEALALPMRPHLTSGAQVILSGLLPHQQAMINSAYAHQGIIYKRHLIRDGWLTMLMQAK